MVYLNDYGFYTLVNQPTKEELADYYARKYFQEDLSSYRASYSEEEHQYFQNKIEQRHLLFSPYLPQADRYRLLDVGCGEGFTLSYFHRLGWEVLGLDYSEHGLKTQNPELLPLLRVGDMEKNLHSLQSEAPYHVLWLDNVLEHALDPLSLLQQCLAISAAGAVLLVEVPNDFSAIQLQAKARGLLASDFWIAVPDHISYFNRQGLINLAQAAGWQHQRTISDFPIDFSLFNPNTNYSLDRSKGKGAHQQRIALDNLFHAISPEKTNRYYEALADLGLGRQLVAVFTHAKV